VVTFWPISTNDLNGRLNVLVLDVFPKGLTFNSPLKYFGFLKCITL
jgi:hypothetical protein